MKKNKRMGFYFPHRCTSKVFVNSKNPFIPLSLSLSHPHVESTQRMNQKKYVCALLKSFLHNIAAATILRPLLLRASLVAPTSSMCSSHSSYSHTPPGPPWGPSPTQSGQNRSPH
jgi:hypothetical protein